jgi:zinc protease
MHAPPPSQPLRIALAVSLLVGGVIHAADTDPRFPQEEPGCDLHPDPSIRFGTLANGLRYAIRPGPLMPDDRLPISTCPVRLRLVVLQGSLDQDADQAGAAGILSRLGHARLMSFPKRQEQRRFSMTPVIVMEEPALPLTMDDVYRLDPPDATMATVHAALANLAAIANPAALTQAALDDSRHALLARLSDELASRDEAMASLDALHARAFAGTRLAPLERPILVNGLRSLTLDRLQAFADRAFRPDDLLVTIEGPIDPAPAIAEIDADFGGLTSRAPRAQARSLGGIRPGVEVMFRSFPSSAGIEIYTVHDDPSGPDTRARRRQDLLRHDAIGVINQRLNELSLDDQTLPYSAPGEFEERSPGVNLTWLRVHCAPGRALAALDRLVRDVRNLTEQGPDPEELGWCHVPLRAPVARSDSDLIMTSCLGPQDSLANCLAHGTVPLDAAQRLALATALVADTSATSIREAIARDWLAAQARVVIVIAGAADASTPTERDVLDAYAAAWREPLVPFAGHAAPDWPYDTVAGSGRIDRDATISPGVRGLVLSNRIEVALCRTVAPPEGTTIDLARATDLVPGRAMVAMRLAIPPAPRQPGLSEFLGSVFTQGGLGRDDIRAIQLHDALAGCRLWTDGPSFDESGATLTTTCTSADLAAGLCRLRAYLTDPGWRLDDRAAGWLSAWTNQLAWDASNPAAAASDAFRVAIFAEAPERRPATLAEARAATLPETMAWFSPILAHAPLEVAIVGDIDIAAAAMLAQRIFGSLPERSAVPTAMTATADARAAFPSGRRDLTVPHGLAAGWSVLVGWPTDDDADVRRTVGLRLLARIISANLRLRPHERVMFSTDKAVAYASDTYPGSGHVVVELTGREGAPLVAARAAILAAAGAVRAGDITQEELAEARQWTLAGIRKPRDGPYWCNFLLRAQERPERLEREAAEAAAVAATTVAELAALANSYLLDPRSFTVTCSVDGSNARTP